MFKIIFQVQDAPSFCPLRVPTAPGYYESTVVEMSISSNSNGRWARRKINRFYIFISLRKRDSQPPSLQPFFKRIINHTYLFVHLRRT